MFNPVMLTQFMRNPQAFMQQAMNNSQIMQNPICRNAIEMYKKGDMQGINELANNLCKEKGVSRQEIERQIRNQFNL